MRQFAILTAVIILITVGAMLLLLSALGSPAPSPPRPTATLIATPDPVPSPTLQPERDAPVQSGAIALIIGAVSGLLVLMLSLSLLRAQRTSQER
ncbi:MAG: hypothetical protein CUN51_01010 [Candidatus Thermofonsia Clade 1 bacterium]|uniref:Uncharacterized protein n=1 Tax=Candidatus Thermofonsia Clade 1 bacterium TaxID=2364210 RepID=A0A2M8P3W5_9CHLR|nr:MAG: hypothetical protein CUN51_01010 [Candidatus Thermofonsia Clade 1 bacterium]